MNRYSILWRDVAIRHDSLPYGCIQKVRILTVIEGDSNDLNTILTTLKEWIRLSPGRVAIVTFGLPIWLKAVDILYISLKRRGT